jgi:hypothetical protein
VRTSVAMDDLDLDLDLEALAGHQGVGRKGGLHIGASHPARLGCMDFRRPRPGKPGGIRYLFDCDPFSDASLAGIVVQPEEIAEHRFADLRTALTMLRKPIRLRVRAATRGHALCYLEDGRPVPGVGVRRDAAPATE